MSGVVAQNVARTSGLIKAAEGGGGAWVEIKTLTSDGSDSDLSFVNGTSDVVLDSTYPVYCFRYTSIHPETDNKTLEFNFSDDTGSSYAVTKTSTFFEASHDESGAGSVLQYNAGNDLAQGTGFQRFGYIDNDNDCSMSGYLYVFGISSSTFIKHFISRQSFVGNGAVAYTTFVAGYANTTSALDAVQFKINSGEIQGGKIKLFGIKDS
tara:strand:+ start:399 stop:1025 length:627 start_codon:yes stop_codon:yes gene_type:complete